MHQVQALAQRCWDSLTPLLIVRSVGFLGFVRVQIREHFVSEVKGEAEILDLRINAPFPELKALCDHEDSIFSNLQIDEMDSLNHAHIPYIILLYKALRLWQQQHSQQQSLLPIIPRTSAEKQELKEIVKRLQRPDKREMNIQEALKEIHRVYQKHHFPTSEAVIEDLDENSSDSFERIRWFLSHVLRAEAGPLANNNTTNRLSHRILLKSLLQYMQTHDGMIPLSGKLPDFTATTDFYRVLLSAYQSKATADYEDFKSIVFTIVKEMNQEQQDVDGIVNLVVIQEDEIHQFCRNILSCDVLRTSPLFSSTNHSAVVMDRVIEYLSEDELYTDPLQTPIIWYLGLLAMDRFFAVHGRYPGDIAQAQDDVDMHQHDIEHVFQELIAMTQGYDIDSESLNKEDAMDVEKKPLISRAVAQEIVRYAGYQVHNISALIGGIAAQEAVKLITHIFVPANNTYVFNGIASVAATYKL
jgi:NEDD8-activating enzyme E1 regulatory subunit